MALQRYGGVQINTRTNRELSRVSRTTDIQLAHAAAAVEIDSAVLDGLQLVAGRALHDVALVSQLEQQLSQLVPLAASRLQAVGDMHALASAQVVANAARRLGR